MTIRETWETKTSHTVTVEWSASKETKKESTVVVAAIIVLRKPEG